MSTPPPPKSKLAPYKQALASISQRTRTPLPSLIVSFAILHEITAVLPVAGFFFGARALGVGEGIVRTFSSRPDAPTITGIAARDSWVGGKLREWMAEGEARAERVGRRYGWFGFEKGSKPHAEPHNTEVIFDSRKLAGDVANFVGAYALTKALLPVRIGLSMYLAPPFSRAFVQPIGSVLKRTFRRQT